MSNVDKLRKIKMDYQLCKIDLIEAKKLAEPILKILNKKSEEIAKRFNANPVVITFESFR